MIDLILLEKHLCILIYTPINDQKKHLYVPRVSIIA
jgi:hypothetical protein